MACTRMVLFDGGIEDLGAAQAFATAPVELSYAFRPVRLHAIGGQLRSPVRIRLDGRTEADGSWLTVDEFAIGEQETHERTVDTQDLTSLRAVLSITQPSWSGRLRVEVWSEAPMSE